ncbi:helicase-associated domain-containing protein [Agromyces sp. SYSU T00194]|uniref:helicase-associated domain-containing protein n=1 Tax=Agromyces chitinivorans TaxID=3158560 RepID=UPI003399447A
MERESVAAAIRSREIDPSGIDDVFDLAEALLADDALDRAFARLDRRLLAFLAIAVEVAPDDGRTDLEHILDGWPSVAPGVPGSDDARRRLDELDARLLLLRDEHGLLVQREVGARLRARIAADLPSASELAAPPPPGLVRDDDLDTGLVDRLAAERAFRTIAALAEVVAAVSLEPARELVRGGLALPDAKRLSAAAGIELDDLPALMDLAARSELVTRDGGHWLETPRGEDWLESDTAERWRRLAAAWRDRLPDELLDLIAGRSRLGGPAPLIEEARWFFPAGGAWLDERARVVTAEADALGLTVAGVPVPAGRSVVAGDLDTAVAATSALLPGHVEQVYVQHDLSIVAPGPLAPPLDARLRVLADVEARELASSYRVSAASVNRALASGETAETLLEFLHRISLTGVPQPLEYLVTETAARYGRLRVGSVAPDEMPARSYVRSDDDALIGTVAVDQSLQALGLVRTGTHRLTSRFGADVVFWALSDARYPVAAEDATGEIVVLRRHRVARVADTRPPRDRIAELVERVLGGADDRSTEQAWLSRRLETAARVREAVTVSVRMPGGDIVDFVLEPTSVANGRMRARDRATDIERTLPISAIAGVADAPSD